MYSHYIQNDEDDESIALLQESSRVCKTIPSFYQAAISDYYHSEIQLLHSIHSSRLGSLCSYT